MENIVELQPDEPIDAEIWQQYLYDKRAVFRFLLRKDPNIKNIGEIGVRSGYGARMFMDNVKEIGVGEGKYFGLDNCISIVGKGGMKWFKKLMKDYDATSFLVDTQDLTSFKVYFNNDFKSYFDFFHIDGCHMKECVYHDLNLVREVLRPGGWILLDDWKDSRVRMGFEKWKKENNLKEVIEFEETLRGDLLVQV